jgi:hypothetical protein
MWKARTRAGKAMADQQLAPTVGGTASMYICLTRPECLLKQPCISWLSDLFSSQPADYLLSYSGLGPHSQFLKSFLCDISLLMPMVCCCLRNPFVTHSVMQSDTRETKSVIKTHADHFIHIPSFVIKFFFLCPRHSGKCLQSKNLGG